MLKFGMPTLSIKYVAQRFRQPPYHTNSVLVDRQAWRRGEFARHLQRTI